MSLTATSPALLTAARKMPDGKKVTRPRRLAMLEAIEAERRQRGLSAGLIARRAGLSERAYRLFLAGECTPAAHTLRRLAQALNAGPAADGADRAALEQLALAGLRGRLAGLGLDHAASRDGAIYAAHVGLGLSQRSLAAHVGVTPQRISALVIAIEDRRERDPLLDRALDAATEPTGARA